MDQETIVGFTRKISASNKSELIVVLYEIYFSYEKEVLDAIKAKEENSHMIQQMEKVLIHLKDALDFQYEISYQLYGLYDYCQRSIVSSIYTRKSEGINRAHRIMSSLQEAFIEVAKEDNSSPLMTNIQQVNAGYTYSKHNLTETIVEGEGPRGYFA